LRETTVFSAYDEKKRCKSVPEIWWRAVCSFCTLKHLLKCIGFLNRTYIMFLKTPFNIMFPLVLNLPLHFPFCHIEFFSLTVSLIQYVYKCYFSFPESRVSCETSFDSKQPKLEPKLVSILSETRCLFRLFRFYIETACFGVSIQPKQNKKQPKQEKINVLKTFIVKYTIFVSCFVDIWLTNAFDVHKWWMYGSVQIPITYFSGTNQSSSNRVYSNITRGGSFSMSFNEFD
jgi:hypothetical protein